MSIYYISSYCIVFAQENSILGKLISASCKPQSTKLTNPFTKINASFVVTQRLVFELLNHPFFLYVKIEFGVTWVLVLKIALNIVKIKLKKN